MRPIKIPSQLPSDIFVFVGEEDRFENLLEYKYHGLHPIVIGDVLPKRCTCVSDGTMKPRYRIILKIGMGAFSLVWLARDLLIIKISHGSQSSHFSGERDILRNINAAGDGKRGFERIITLLDSFIISGPNGFHECLVTEVVVPLSTRFIQEASASNVIRQLLEGFMFLHEQGIVHGDPHPGNIGLAIPHLNQLSEDEVIEYFAVPETIPVVPRSADFPMETIPPYIIETVPLASLIQGQGLPQKFQFSVKILDFGRAFRTDQVASPLPGAVPEMFCAPEFMLSPDQNLPSKTQASWSKEGDIWAIGCLLYFLLFEAELVRDWQPTNKKLAQAIRLGGPPPKEWVLLSSSLQTCLREISFPSAQIEAWDVCSGQIDEKRTRWLQSREKRELIDLIRRMIVTHPSGRQQMTELLQHPFLR